MTTKEEKKHYNLKAMAEISLLQQL